MFDSTKRISRAHSFPFFTYFMCIKQKSGMRTMGPSFFHSSTIGRTPQQCRGEVKRCCGLLTTVQAYITHISSVVVFQACLLQSCPAVTILETNESIVVPRSKTDRVMNRLPKRRMEVAAGDTTCVVHMQLYLLMYTWLYSTARPGTS